MAGQISTQIAMLIENNIANYQRNNEEAASVTKAIAASKNLIAQELGQVIRKSLEEESKIAHEKLEGLMKF